MKNRISSNKLILTGAVIFTASIAFLIFLFYPVIIAELKYIFSDKGENSEVILKEEIKEKENEDKKNYIYPIDENFSIIIPKIGANSKVIENVDPYNSVEYQQKLSEGVAHSKTSKLPNESGSVFLFAHSSTNFYEANRWNSVFYLLHRMEMNDEIYIVYKKEIIKYKVKETKKVNPSEVQYLNQQTDKKELILMTCWPPGSDWERLIVVAEQV